MKLNKIIIIAFSLVCIFTLILFSIFNFVLYPKKYGNFVVAYSNKYNLPTPLVYAVIKTESNFNSNARSTAGAMGLMQLIPSTAKWIASELQEEYVENNLYIPETNIKYGCFYLNYLYQKFQDIDIVICAYNAGEVAVKKWLDDSGKLVIDAISYKETKNYYFKVKGYYNAYLQNNIGL